jgi:hypothetical protein
VCANQAHPCLNHGLRRGILHGRKMFLAHSVALKLMTYKLAGTAAFFETEGLPGSLAYATFAAEAVGGRCWCWKSRRAGSRWRCPPS